MRRGPAWNHRILGTGQGYTSLSLLVTSLTCHYDITNLSADIVMALMKITIHRNSMSTIVMFSRITEPGVG